jgi:Xaa-Pro aminopeptidase
MNAREMTRRNVMRLTATGVLGAGLIARVDRVAAMQPTPARSRSIAGKLKTLPEHGSAASQLPRHYGGVDRPPMPTKLDMLPREWRARQTRKLFDTIAKHSVSAVLLRDPNNVTYYTGYSFSSTERPQSVFFNRDDEAPWYFHPMVDNDLIRDGWYGGGRMYFDFPHAAGGFPNDGKVVTGPAVDLLEFMLEGLHEKGVQGGRIGVDGELYPSELAKFHKILPGIAIVDITDDINDMRRVKTDEELALWSRAYVYGDQAHAFARDYLLTYGTDITDLEIKLATELWLQDKLFSELDLAGGLPNRGVGAIGEVEVRVGRVNAYPHPNQPYYARVRRGEPLQVVSYVFVGGCGGENYRMYQIADERGQFDAHGTRLWEVTRHCCDIQLAMQKEGAVCGDIAYAIHKFQVEAGMQDYIYHRPGHGQSTEGHSSPYIALGDRTVLKRNMIFSEEPGLYDPKNGIGYNWSDNIVTGVESGYRMSFTPYSRDWLFVNI